MNGKLPRAGLPDETRNQLSVCHRRQPDRSGRHPEQAIFERDMKLFAAVHIHHYKQMPARPQELTDVGHLVYIQEHGHVGRRAEGVLVTCEALQGIGGEAPNRCCDNAMCTQPVGPSAGGLKAYW